MGIDPITQCNLAPTFRLRLEHKDGHYKFWEATGRSDGSVIIRYGRIGDWGTAIIRIGALKRKPHRRSTKATQ